MKRIVALVVLMLLLSIGALADSIVSVLPVSSVWGASMTAFIADSGYDLAKIKVDSADALKLTGIDVESYTMDAYFVFSANMKTHKGLSRILYVVSDGDQLSGDEKQVCKNALTDALNRDLGNPQSGSTSKWVAKGMSIQVGNAKVSSSGGNGSTVGFVVKGVDISNADGKNVDSLNASVPSKQAAMRRYMFDPLSRQGSLNDFLSGLQTIQGLEYASGSKGEAVSEIQRLLVNSDFLSDGDVDGIFGKKTQKALGSFQSQNGLSNTSKADLATQCMLVLKNATFEKKESCYIAQVGNYAVVIWPLKAFYIGMLDRSGQFSTGTYYYVNGEYYSGDYKNGLRAGQGIARYSNGDVYIGAWENDKMHGKGTYYFSGEGSKTYYEGELSKNLMSGAGTYWANGKAITGTWYQNKHVGW